MNLPLFTKREQKILIGLAIFGLLGPNSVFVSML